FSFRRNAVRPVRRHDLTNADSPIRRFADTFLLLLVLLPVGCFAQRLTPLSKAPDWGQLNGFQETITHDEFIDLLSSVYAPDGAGAQWITLEPTRALIRENASNQFVLRFAPSAEATKPIPRYWTPAESLKPNNELPLSDVKIAIDPGHLGGAWARMEERWFQIENSIPVTEGDMTLRVAQILAPRLQSLGAQVTLVRSAPGPVTTIRPEELKVQAEASLRDRGITDMLRSDSRPDDPNREGSIPWEAERLFYRVDEIHARAKIVNEKIKPDLVLCLHFNAEPWGDPAHPVLVSVNHLHLLANGAYSPSELGFDDERFTMLVKLLTRTYAQELSCSESVARSMARITGLPPYRYSTSNAKSVGESGYVWARNLLANRLYQCPVIFIEAYVMNSQEFFARFQAGEYEGLRNFEGVMRPNVFEEYAEGVADGLAAYFRAARR
ncbi:MAG: N-acetylmuramoyl-L-alanine amidase, partial [Verrucomicrobia bacterium]|nr:N-acetylmuramoyl-L-alanine amidase [Verrucomicrobiota bacterium]